MNPQTPWCHNTQCPARGQQGHGNIRVHSRAEQRYRCTTCGQTFAATQESPFYRLRTAADVVTIVLTWLSPGCPTQAMVAAFGLDERTVAAWLTRAGQHCQRVHQHMVQQGRVDLQHVQADELWGKLVGRRVWLAMALAIPSRLWLGGVISPQRDRVLITTLVQMIRSGGRSLAILVCVDGLTSSVTAFLRVFRQPVRTGRRGRPRLVLEAGRLIGQMVKRYVRRRVVGVERRVVRGTAEAITAGLVATGGGRGINTAYIERLNATFRSALAVLARRGRAIAHTEAVLTAGMWLVGGTYHFCWLHDSLRIAAPAGACWKWQERTPAMAAGLTDHRWTMLELFRYQVPLPAWVAPKRRGRHPSGCFNRQWCWLRDHG
ncbi:MAG: transposase [Candidatus Entotheonellia bacterium]